mmetsp:Transcript_709/g.1031  ORF Transcript_709/g.1031 Transcript_709/m.1031 type:complete len:644 (+) Transcript_709:34-1965(+)
MKASVILLGLSLKHVVCFRSSALNIRKKAHANSFAIIDRYASSGNAAQFDSIKYPNREISAENFLENYEKILMIDELMKDTELLKSSLSDEKSGENPKNGAKRSNLIESSGAYGYTSNFSSKTLQMMENYSLKWGEFVAKLTGKIASVGINIQNKATVDINTLREITLIIQRNSNVGLFSLISTLKSSLPMIGSSKAEDPQASKHPRHFDIDLSIAMMKFDEKNPKLLSSVNNMEQKGNNFQKFVQNQLKRRKSVTLPQNMLKTINTFDDAAYSIENEIKYEKPGRKTANVLNRLGLSSYSPDASYLPYNNDKSRKNLPTENSQKLILENELKINQNLKNEMKEEDWMFDQLSNRPKMLLKEIELCLGRLSSVEIEIVDITERKEIHRSILKSLNAKNDGYSESDARLRVSNDVNSSMNYMDQYLECANIALGSVADSLVKLERFRNDIEREKGESTRFDNTSEVLVLMQKINVAIAKPILLLKTIETYSIKVKKSIELVGDSALAEILTQPNKKLALKDTSDIEESAKNIPSNESSVIHVLHEEFEGIKEDGADIVIVQKSSDTRVLEMSDGDVNILEDEGEKSRKIALKTLDLVALLVEKVLFVVLPKVISTVSFASNRLDQYYMPQGHKGWKIHSMLKKV